MKTFITFDGKKIQNIVSYVEEHLSMNPNLSISVGCDSSPGNIIYFVLTVVLYDTLTRKGAHVVYYRESLENKNITFFTRLQRESELALEVAELLHNSLSEKFQRKDLSDFERKKYKFHLLRNNGLYPHVDTRYEENVIKNITLTESEKMMEYKLIDIHVDFNSKEGYVDKKGLPKNKSNILYKTWVPYLRSLGYRVFVKPSAFAASSAADILLQ